MKKILTGFLLLASTGVMFATTYTINAGNGTFTTQGEIQTFNLLPVSAAPYLTQVTITLTSAASETGAVITNTSAATTSDVTGTITSSYATTLMGLLSGGSVNLSDSQMNTLAPSEFATYNVSDGDTSVITITNPGFLALFLSASPTANIQATTLSSAFSVDTTPIANIGINFGTLSTDYTWDVTYTVPEPSAALLGGLGLLALLRRRRA